MREKRWKRKSRREEKRRKGEKRNMIWEAMEKLRVPRIERDSGRVFCCREGDRDNGHEEEENESKNE